MCAIFCVTRCILWPGTKIVIAAKTRGQSINILDEKIMKELYPRSPNLRYEIKDWVINQSQAQIQFKNGSYIVVVTANDNSRGHRCNILCVDESRLVDKAMIDLVLKKFLTSPRHPGYLEKPEYSHLIERNKEMYLTSAWMKSHWNYELAKDYFSNMLNPDKKYFCCCFPYQMSIKEGLLIKEAVEDEMSESTFSDINFRMEYGAEWIGATDGGLFNFDELNVNRVVRKAFYAPNVALPNGLKISVPDKEKGEIRILSVDIALMASRRHDNDATSIFLNSMKPNKNNRYTSNMVYSENAEGITSQELSLKIRRYIDYFDCDYIVIDAKGIGLPIVDLLMDEIYDPEYGVTYQPLNCINNDDVASRCKYKNAPKKIWAIMGSAIFNNDAAIMLRTGFQQGRIHLLMNEYECDQALRETFKGYDKLNPTERMALQLPFINTGLAVNELVNLQYESSNNLVRVYEKPGARKDRYSSISYNYYVAQKIERSTKNKGEAKGSLPLMYRAPTIKR